VVNGGGVCPKECKIVGGVGYRGVEKNDRDFRVRVKGT
jgi:hypothetical protein